MLVLNPSHVRFKGEALEGVSAVSVDRVATREVVEWTELGPHVAFADVAEQRVTLSIVRDVAGEELSGLEPGEQGEVSFIVSRTAADGRRRRVSAEGVVTRIAHKVDVGKRATQTITLIAVSSDGQAEPVAVEEV